MCIDENDEIKSEIQLTKKQTKGQQARTVFVSKRMRKELDRYIKHAVVRFSGGFLYSKHKRASGFRQTQLHNCYSVFTKEVV